jgi:4-amino-4-deoxy-L-arabinose transferase-like glycosyltransferase
VKNEAKPQKEESKANLVLPFIVLIFLVFAWLVYVYANQPWLTALERVAQWLSEPTVNYAQQQIEGLALAVIATIEILILGTVSARSLLAEEKDPYVKVLSTLGLGTGFTGLITILLGIFWNLYQMQLNLAIVLLCTCFLLASYFTQFGKQRPSLRHFLKAHFVKVQLKRPNNFGLWLLALLSIGTTFFFIFYFALSTVVTHWDATVYHAVVSVIMYNNHGIPVIAGPSIGIEMSANFPPLFSALGAYYYIQVGSIQDVYLRIIPPLMGLLTVLATYKIGEVLYGKRFGLISAVFLAITPLFFRYSIFATSYSILTFFGTTSVLFFFLAMKNGTTRYWVASGAFYGFALLTSYLALYLAPFFIIALTYCFIKQKRSLRIDLKIPLVFILTTLAIGGAWYARNLILVGNPIYPNAYTLLGGINIDPLIMETTLTGLKNSASAAFFGNETTILGKTAIFLTYRTHFPAISLITVLGTVWLLFQSKKSWLVMVWPLSVSLIILSGITWGFPRHIMLALPGFALLSALPIAKALDKCESYDLNIISDSKSAIYQTRRKIPSLRKSNLLRISIAAILVVAFVFPSLTLVMGGKVGMDNIQDEPRDNYLWFLENPNSETWLQLENVFTEAKAWEWINENLHQGEKVATIENRIYYIKNCSNDYFFYLDGWEARHLYNITDLTAILRYFESQNIKYVLDVDWAREHGHFDILPMATFLGTPFFPQITYDGAPRIFSVWSNTASKITANSTIPIAINQKGWTATHLVNGVPAQSIEAGSDSPRFSVVTANLTSVKLTYLDSGTDKLDIYVYDQTSEEWPLYMFIQKTNTQEWKTCEFLVPVSKNEYTDFALHSYREDFTLSKIEAEPLQAPGRSSLYSLKYEITDLTNPPALIVYLPILYAKDIVSVRTSTFDKEMCIEVFEGVIQPWENTEWWGHRELAVRSPDSIVVGQNDPSLVWNVEKTGFYTVVLVLREGYVQDTRVDLQISIGGNLTKNGG